MQFVDEIVTRHDNGNPRVVLGDFNTVPESDELRWLVGQHTLGGRRVAYQDAWVAVHQDRPGHTWSRANDYTEKMHWLRRDRRLDYIFVTPVRRDRRATVRAAAVVFDAARDAARRRAHVRLRPLRRHRRRPASGRVLAMFRLAHVTDPHFRGPRGSQGPRAGELLGKRAIGYVNLVVNRVRKHKMDLLEDLRVDLRAQAPDHLALTGDLSNIAVTSEWRSALAWLDMSGVAPDAISVIPGNHDAYVPEVLATREFERLFGPYQTSDLDRDARGGLLPVRADPRAAGADRRLQRRRHRRSRRLGAVGEAQLARLEAILKAPELAGLTRVVLVHHPPVLHKDGEHRNLRDREAFAAVLARAGADLVLHGHDHADQRAELPGPGGAKIPIIGAGSASYAGGPERRARYSVYEFEDGAITWVSRVHDEATSFFREARREKLTT